MLGSQTLVKNPDLVVNEREATPSVLATLGAEHGMSVQHIKFIQQNLPEQLARELFHGQGIDEKCDPVQALGIDFSTASTEMIDKHSSIISGCYSQK